MLLLYKGGGYIYHRNERFAQYVVLYFCQDDIHLMILTTESLIKIIYICILGGI